MKIEIHHTQPFDFHANNTTISLIKLPPIHHYKYTTHRELVPGASCVLVFISHACRLRCLFSHRQPQQQLKEHHTKDNPTHRGGTVVVWGAKSIKQSNRPRPHTHRLLVTDEVCTEVLRESVCKCVCKIVLFFPLLVIIIINSHTHIHISTGGGGPPLQEEEEAAAVSSCS